MLVCWPLYRNGKVFVKRTSVKSGGRTLTYLQLVESYRDEGRVRTRLVKGLGREDRLDPSEIDSLMRSLAPYGSLRVGDEGHALEEVELRPGREFGAVYALDFLWRELELDKALAELARGRRFAFPVADVIKAMVFGRVLHPGSERALITTWLSTVAAPEFGNLELQHAYRALPFLADVGPQLEARLARLLTEKLFVDATLVLFDTTSIYFEGVGPELASYGYSRDHRPDRRQVNLALLTSREGVPLAHWLFPGRQSDVRSMAEASREFRSRLPLGSFVVVADRGMVSEANLEALRSEGTPYVIAEKLRRKRTHQALSRAGRYRRVTPTLEVKEIAQEGSERVLLCRNAERADADRHTRESILAKLENTLEQGSWREFLPPGTRRYLRVTGGKASINRERVKDDAKYDGKWVLRTTTDLPPDQVALAYRGLWRVERTFRTLKTPLEIRPVFHTSEAGVRGHIQTCVLAYTLARVLEDRLEAAGIDLDAKQALAELARIQQVPLHEGHVTITKTTTPNEQQKAILTAIGAPPPPQHNVT